MARRPAAPRPTGTRRDPGSGRPTGELPEQRAPQHGADATPARRTYGRASTPDSPSSPSSPSADRTAVTTKGRAGDPAGTRVDTHADTREDTRADNVVPAADRFRAMVTGRPWRRRRRAIIAGVIVAVLLLVAALSAAIWLPALRLQQISVSGLGYVEEQTVRDQLDPRLGDSVLLLPTDAIGEDLAAVPGVRSAEVERRWPDGMHVTVVESEPVSQLTRPDGTVAILDEAGEELPAAAAEGATLVPLSVGATSQNPDGATEAMIEVLAELPDQLRPSVQDMTASSPSDVTFTLALEDGGTKTVVWGDARDAELKGDVVQALIPEPGSVIDVSSPVAPVTR